MVVEKDVSFQVIITWKIKCEHKKLRENIERLSKLIMQMARNRSK